ncbi:NAD-binding protein [Streptomyces sp. NPDC050698]
MLTGRYAAGFGNALMAKDVRLSLDEVRRLSGARAMGAVTGSAWEAFSEAEPGADFTRIYPFVAGD